MEQSIAQQTAGTVRAELGRRRISGREMARALDWKPSTARRRLNGESPFNIDELAAVAAFLEVAPSSLLGAVDSEAAA